MMSLTKQDKSRRVLKINAQRTRQDMGYNPKRELRKDRILNQDELSSETSITLMTTRSSRICSHQ